MSSHGVVRMEWLWQEGAGRVKQAQGVETRSSQARKSVLDGRVVDHGGAIIQAGALPDAGEPVRATIATHDPAS